MSNELVRRAPLQGLEKTGLPPGRLIPLNVTITEEVGMIERYSLAESVGHVSADCYMIRAHVQAILVPEENTVDSYFDGTDHLTAFSLIMPHYTWALCSILSYGGAMIDTTLGIFYPPTHMHVEVEAAGIRNVADRRPTEEDGRVLRMEGTHEISGGDAQARRKEALPDPG